MSLWIRLDRQNHSHFMEKGTEVPKGSLTWLKVIWQRAHARAQGSPLLALPSVFVPPIKMGRNGNYLMD